MRAPAPKATRIGADRGPMPGRAMGDVMPTYEYECDACGHTFERFQSITARPVRTCPACGKRQVRRLIGTGAGVLFRGSGFYQTDYRSSSYRKAAEADKPKGDGGGTGPASGGGSGVAKGGSGGESGGESGGASSGGGEGSTASKD